MTDSSASGENTNSIVFFYKNNNVFLMEDINTLKFYCIKRILLNLQIYQYYSMINCSFLHLNQRNLLNYA